MAILKIENLTTTKRSIINNYRPPLPVFNLNYRKYHINFRAMVTVEKKCQQNSTTGAGKRKLDEIF